MVETVSNTTFSPNPEPTTTTFPHSAIISNQSSLMSARPLSAANQNRVSLTANGHSENADAENNEEPRTLDDIFGSAFGQDWQMQRPHSSLEQRMSLDQKKSYVHYLLGRGEKGAVYHQLWFPGTSLSFSLDPCEPQPPRSSSTLVGYSTSDDHQSFNKNDFDYDNDGRATPHAYIKRSISSIKSSLWDQDDIRRTDPRSEIEENNNQEMKAIEYPSQSETRRQMRPVSAKTHREIKTVALNANSMIPPTTHNQVFDPRKIPKTPRPLSNAVARKRSKKLSHRLSANKIPVASQNLPAQEGLEVTGAPTQFSEHHSASGTLLESSRKTPTSVSFIKVVPPSEDRGDEDLTKREPNDNQSLLAIEFNPHPSEPIKDQDQDIVLFEPGNFDNQISVPLSQSSPRNLTPDYEITLDQSINNDKSFEKSERSQSRSGSRMANGPRGQNAHAGFRGQNVDDSLNNSKLSSRSSDKEPADVINISIGNAEVYLMKVLDVSVNVQEGFKRSFDHHHHHHHHHQKDGKASNDQNDEVNTTFGSDTSCVQPSANMSYTIPEYKVEKYKLGENLPLQDKLVAKSQSDSVPKFKLPKEEKQRYDIISDEPWGFDLYYEPLFPKHLQKLDLENLANLNRDWRAYVGELLPSEDESAILDRMLEMAKHQSSTVRLEDELKKPRYMRPRSSQLSTNSIVNAAAATVNETPTVTRNNSSNGTRARSALASISSRFCPECKHTPCSDSCRYQLQPPPAPSSHKVAPVFKRCYLCRQMNCPGGQSCTNQRKLKQIHSAKHETKRPSTSLKSTVVGSNQNNESQNNNNNRLLAIEYHSDRNGYTSSLTNQKRLIKLATKHNRSSSRPKSAGSLTTRRAQLREAITYKNDNIELDSGSKCSLNQVNLSSSLADNLESDSSYRPVTCTYLPKPPPAGRDILSLEQRLAVLSMPVSKLARSKSSINPDHQNFQQDGNVQTYRTRKSRTPRSIDEVVRHSKQGSKSENGGNGSSIVELLVPRIALPSQPEPPSVYVSVYRSHNLSAYTGRFRGTKRLGGRLTAFT